MFPVEFNQATLDGLFAVSDWPRVNLYKARWGKEIIPGIPKWFDEKGTENHKAGYVAASVLVEGMAKWYDRVNEFLDRWLKWHNWNEQCSSIYDTYYLSAVCAFDHCAKRDGYPTIREKCQRYFQNTVNLWSQLRDIKQRVISPGKRTSDKGWDIRRDQSLRVLLGEELLSWSDERWADQYNMEVALIAQWGSVEKWNFEFDGNTHIGLRDPIKISIVNGGFIARTDKLTKCYGFPCWGVWSINGHMGSISWKDVDIKPKAAKGMGSGKTELNINLVPHFEELFPKVPILSTKILT